MASRGVRGSSWRHGAAIVLILIDRGAPLRYCPFRAPPLAGRYCKIPPGSEAAARLRDWNTAVQVKPQAFEGRAEGSALAAIRGVVLIVSHG